MNDSTFLVTERRLCEHCGGRGKTGTGAAPYTCFECHGRGYHDYLVPINAAPVVVRLEAQVKELRSLLMGQISDS